MRRIPLLACLAAPAIGHANEASGPPPAEPSFARRLVDRADPSIVVHAGASTHGAIAGGTVDVRTGKLAWTTRLDAAIDRLDRGELIARYRLTPAREERVMFAIAGARVDSMGVYGLAGGRFGDRDASLLLAAVARVHGDAMFVQHARYVPGWLARGELRASRVVLGGELGASGVATRGPDGTLHIDARAILTIGARLW